MARRLARTGIRNIRLVEGTGQEMLRELLPESSVETFWINFPDPWPKKRHHRRRLIQPAFLRDLAVRLQPGGRLEVATDHEDYSDWIDRVLTAEPLLENVHTPEPFLREVPGRMCTAYQMEWMREGRSLYFWSYRRR
jgi:tRNA (guanine-N7-)-methyltransferase